jgi:uncharacterized protein with HEPN domain
MLSRSEHAAPLDIEHHLSLISEFVAGLDFDKFAGDLRTNYAVIRCLEIISEASRRLPDDLKARHPQIAWKQIATAGNVYRHDYEPVAAEQIWQTLEVALPVLKTVIAFEIARLV